MSAENIVDVDESQDINEDLEDEPEETSWTRGPPPGRGVAEVNEDEEEEEEEEQGEGKEQKTARPSPSPPSPRARKRAQQTRPSDRPAGRAAVAAAKRRRTAELGEPPAARDQDVVPVWLRTALDGLRFEPFSEAKEGKSAR